MGRRTLPIASRLIRWRRLGVNERVVLGAYFVMAGLLRFAIEFVRINERVIGPLTVAHVASLVAVAGRVALLYTSQQQD